jgi:hypothetical protein
MKMTSCHTQAICANGFPARWSALFALAVLAAGIPVLAAKQELLPTWLDTIAPRVKIMPAQKYHNTIFHVTFETNEHAIIHYGINSTRRMDVYSNPLTFAMDGNYTIYYFGEDDYGNKSRIDSMTYTFDSRPPDLSLVPPPGFYKSVLTVHFYTNKRCRFYLVKDPTRTTGKEIPDSIQITDSLRAYIAAVDSAGNQTVSDEVEYIIDTTKIMVRAVPSSGTFNTFKPIKLHASSLQAEIFYSFDPSATAEMFYRYYSAIPLPYGLSVLHFYGRNAAGFQTEIQRARFVVDTIPPRLKMDRREGPAADTVYLSTREPATIYYIDGGNNPTVESPVYSRPIVVPHRGRYVLKAIATDSAGNTSPPLEWEGIFDKIPPIVSISPTGGTFSKSVQITLSSNEPATILFTIDGTPPSAKSLVYQAPFAISREGLTTIRCYAVDEGRNPSPEKQAVFMLDSRPPQVQIHIEQNIKEDQYTVTFGTDEKATIYYEINKPVPARSSPVYKDPVTLHSGQTLSYVAIDAVGNATEVRVIDDLQKPLIAASPKGGAYNHRIFISFATNMASEVYWRLPPDTGFQRYNDSIRLDVEGLHTLEYYSRSPEGITSPLRRNEYLLDWTPPQASISLKKGFKDSVTVFLECSENASIYYTTDGSTPLFSPTVHIAGNKLTMSKDRLSICRTASTKLAFYAEDAVGNQSALTILDLSKPRAIPSAPAGRERVYNRFLSIGFNTVDEKAQVYYARHGHIPTIDSSVFYRPVTLVRSDTISAFVIDASGYKGQVDTFIYLIDLPPLPQFLTVPDTPTVNQTVRFDATGTVDQETPREELLFRWDFDGDSTFDTDYLHDCRTIHTYAATGAYRPRLEVKDRKGSIAVFSRELSIQEVCPEDMISFCSSDGRTFCIDRYEWPNVNRHVPKTNVSWVEAKMQCIDQGKRLCTAEEWELACRAGSSTSYPYGSQYRKGKCPTDGKQPYRSGSFSHCQSAPGLGDMVGNVWEWVDSKAGDYPMMRGGSINSGKNANCRFQAEGTVATQSGVVGFRCCR